MNRLIGPIAASVVAGTLFMTATPASAVDNRSTETRAKLADGTLKAISIFDDVNNRLCVRAYNSGAGAVAVATIALNNNEVYRVSDRGGDDLNSCIAIGELSRGSGWTLSAAQSGSGGAGASAREPIPA